MKDPLESEAQYIVRRMSELGFHPSPGETDRVPFYKDYADSDGRRVRVYVSFDKPILGMHALRLANFVVSAQTTIAPTFEGVDREAPDVLRADLLSVLDSFQDLVGRIPDQAAASRICVRCGDASAEYFVVNSDAVCRRCVNERKAAQ